MQRINSGVGSALERLRALSLSHGTKEPGRHRRVVEAGGVLLDVRTQPEFSEGHVEGALNIPVQELPGRLHEVTSRSKEVVVYCRSGARSQVAKRILEQVGCNVTDIATMANW